MNRLVSRGAMLGLALCALATAALAQTPPAPTPNKGWCGEDMAKAERKSWTVVQEFGKGGYMFVTANAAHTTLRETNQKSVRT